MTFWFPDLLKNHYVLVNKAFQDGLIVIFKVPAESAMAGSSFYSELGREDLAIYFKG